MVSRGRGMEQNTMINDRWLYGATPQSREVTQRLVGAVVEKTGIKQGDWKVGSAWIDFFVGGVRDGRHMFASIHADGKLHKSKKLYKGKTWNALILLAGKPELAHDPDGWVTAEVKEDYVPHVFVLPRSSDDLVTDDDIEYAAGLIARSYEMKRDHISTQGTNKDEAFTRSSQGPCPSTPPDFDHPNGQVMRADTADIMATVRECIAHVGQEFHDMGGDARFFSEADLHQRLLARLWEAAELSLPVDCSSPSSEEPRTCQVFLAHSERTAESRDRADIAIYDREVVRNIVLGILPYKDWARRLEGVDRLATIEVKNVCVDELSRRRREPGPLGAWAEELRRDLDKIRAAVATKSSVFGLFLVFASTLSLAPTSARAHGHQWRTHRDIALVRQAAEQLTLWKDEAFQGNPNCGVFWASDHPDDPPRFL